MNELRELYEEMILDHNRTPHNYMRKPEGKFCSAHGFNPLCNDEFKVYLKIEDNVIKDACFEGAGCAISTASASLMTDAVKDKTIEEVRELFRDMHSMLTTGDEIDDKYFKLKILAGVRDIPIRIKCATLAWHTLNAALENSQDTVTTE